MVYFSDETKILTFLAANRFQQQFCYQKCHSAYHKKEKLRLHTDSLSPPIFNPRLKPKLRKKEIAFVGQPPNICNAYSSFPLKEREDYFANRSTAFLVFSKVLNAVKRKYPSPLAPKPEPGVPTI